MKIIIGKEEIEEAVECYLKQQGLEVSEYSLDIKMVVGRTDDARIEVDLKKQSQSSEDVPTGPISRDAEEAVTTDPFA